AADARKPRALHLHRAQTTAPRAHASHRAPRLPRRILHLQRLAMIKGSCACGGITFEVEKVLALTTCHCSICRKLSGSAVGAYRHVAKKDFRLVSGEELMTNYESTPGSTRKFCKVCGSTAPGQAPYLPTVSIPAGLFDNDPGVKPMLH